MRALEDRHRMHALLVEAETKRLQDIAITEWVEQQQNKQSENIEPSRADTKDCLNADLIDLSFLSSSSPSSLGSQKTSAHSASEEPPPPYKSNGAAGKPTFNLAPLPLASHLHHTQLPSTSTVPLNFPAPQQPGGCVTPTASGNLPPQRSYWFPVPPHLSYSGNAFSVSPPVQSTAPAPSLSTTITTPTTNAAAITHFPSPAAIPTDFASAQRTTIEEYQRKYPVLSDPERVRRLIWTCHHLLLPTYTGRVYLCALS